MKKILALAVLLLVQTAVAEEFFANNTTADNNNSAGWLPQVNLSDIGQKLGNATQTGLGPVDDALKFLGDASPFLLLIIGIVLIVLSGFGKLLGIILVVLALIRLLWMFL